MKVLQVVRTVGSRWFLGSILLGSFALLVNAAILTLSKNDTPLSELVEDGGLIAAALTVQLEWLAAVWFGTSGPTRNRLILTDGIVVAALLVCFTLTRVDVMTPAFEIFDQGRIAWLSGCAVAVAVVTTATSAAVLQIPTTETDEI